MTVNNEIRNAFNQHAHQYEQFARVQQEIGTRLLERLDYLKQTPKRILDLGCGSGYFSEQLRQRYPQAEIMGLDLSSKMLQEAKKRQQSGATWSLTQADLLQLPFDHGVFDLIFANQVIHWASSLPRVFREMNRVMSHEGCLMFTTLGPDTFMELRRAFFAADPYAHVNDFVDLHVLGDGLLSELFLDPVVDMAFLTAHYPSVRALLSSLKAQGVRNIHQQRNRGLTGRQSWGVFLDHMETFVTPQGHYPLTYEVIYGHAWKGALHRHEQGTQAIIPLSKIQKFK